MKIRISDLPADGLKVSDTMSLEALNARLQEGKGSDIFFSSPPKLEISVIPTQNGAQARGKVIAPYRQPCSLCLDEVPKQLEIDVDFILQPRDPNLAGAETEVEDIGIIYYEGESANLEDALQESLILELEIFWHPKCDRAGKCEFCGVNQKSLVGQEPSSQKLGSLLAKLPLKQ